MHTITDSQQITAHVAKIKRRAKVIGSNHELKLVLARFESDAIRREVYASIESSLTYQNPVYPDFSDWKPVTKQVLVDDNSTVVKDLKD